MNEPILENISRSLKYSNILKGVELMAKYKSSMQTLDYALVKKIVEKEGSVDLYNECAPENAISEHSIFSHKK